MIKRSVLIISSTLIIGLGFTSFTANDGFEISKQIEIFITFYKKLNQNYVDETNPAELMNIAIKSITDEMDPYTKFWAEQDVIASKIRSTGQYTGIGSKVHSKDKRLYISEPFKGFPADKSGLKAGDEIIKIDDITVSDFDGEAKELLKGKAGSKVILTYIRNSKKLVASVNRSLVDVDAVPFYKLLDDNTAYIVLQKFNNKASSQTIAALKELKAKGANKVILDLRGNPGGLLREAVNVCNIFIPKNQLIVYTESVIEANNKVYKTKKEPIDTKIPLAILVNGRSASASEIVSGVMQDLDRGVIIGSRSFGKGLVQTHKKLAYNTQLKVTSSRYFIPSKRCIQALDYWHKDKNGKPKRIKDSDYNAFKTLKNKRTVYDGGGVFPDVETNKTAKSNLANILLKEKAIFNFATEFYYNHQFSDLNNFNFSENDYQNFKKYLSKIDFKYETKTEKSLEEAMTYAIKEKIDKSISDEYNSIVKRINEFKKEDLKNQEKELKILLRNEILKRYFYREGMYAYNAKNSDEINTAKIILNDIPRYNKILGN